MFRYLPEPASELAPQIDFLNNVITDISVFFTVLIVGTMIYFAVKYRRRNGIDHPTPQIKGSHTLEIIWTVVPTIVVIFITIYGIKVFHRLRTVPDNALEIGVWGQQWWWDFEYPNGKRVKDDFVVPVDTPIKLVMKSREQDPNKLPVLHSFFIPAMRVKNDVLPNIYSYVSFKPIKTGTYQAYCTEYCGTNHSGMLAQMKVVSKAEYEMWLNDNSDELLKSRMSATELGAKLYKEKSCNTCHSLDGSRLVGPSFLNLFGKKELCTDGFEHAVDENYLQESILNSNKLIVESYQPNMMPAFEGQLKTEEVSALIAFIKNQKGAAVATATTTLAATSAFDTSKLNSSQKAGYEVYQTKLCASCHSLDGNKLVGPSFKGVWGREEKLVDGRKIKVDEAYFKKSINEPSADVVEGYPPAMPALAATLSEQNIIDLIEFMKTLK